MKKGALEHMGYCSLTVLPDKKEALAALRGFHPDALKPLNFIIMELSAPEYRQVHLSEEENDYLRLSAVKIIQEKLPREGSLFQWGDERWAILLPFWPTAKGQKWCQKVGAAFSRAAPSSFLHIGKSVPSLNSVLVSSPPHPAENLPQAALSRLLSDREKETSIFPIMLRSAPMGSFPGEAFLGACLRQKDPYLEDIAGRSAKVAAEFARLEGFGPEIIRILSHSAYFMDCGMCFLPIDLLWQRGALTLEQKTAVNKHPCFSATIARYYGAGTQVRTAVATHHENYDGSGYPHGLKKEETPSAAYILALSSAFVTMQMRRPYRAALTPEMALSVIRKKSGSVFHPELADAFNHRAAALLEVLTLHTLQEII